VWEAVALAFALAMDATAVAAARGLVRGHRGEVVVLPLLFGGFQAGMAALGWVAGDWGGGLFAAWDHWLAFALLALIGGKMVIEGWRGGDDHAPPRRGAMLYLALAVATSIDAAAAGLTLPLLAVDPWLAIGLIGAVTLACSLAGYLLGRVVGGRFGKALEVVGGVILIAIGARILIEHLA
jgi:putative Mn2+ efflux pump MntP